MKNIILVFLVTTAFIGCEKEALVETDFESTGIIMGTDKGLCPCCGGWILKIDEDSTAYRFEILPQDADIELSETPTSVRFNSSVNRECGELTYLDIESIELN